MVRLYCCMPTTITQVSHWHRIKANMGSRNLLCFEVQLLGIFRFSSCWHAAAACMFASLSPDTIRFAAV